MCHGKIVSSAMKKAEEEKMESEKLENEIAKKIEESEKLRTKMWRSFDEHDHWIIFRKNLRKFVEARKKARELIRFSIKCKDLIFKQRLKWRWWLISDWWKHSPLGHLFYYTYKGYWYLVPFELRSLWWDIEAELIRFGAWLFLGRRF